MGDVATGWCLDCNGADWVNDDDAAGGTKDCPDCGGTGKEDA